MTVMYIVSLDHPTKQIYKGEYTVVSGKYSWAISDYGKRRLVGASAFFTLASAERAKLGQLMKITSNSYLRCHNAQYVAKAQEQINCYKIFKQFIKLRD